MSGSEPAARRRIKIGRKGGIAPAVLSRYPIAVSACRAFHRRGGRIPRYAAVRVASKTRDTAALRSRIDVSSATVLVIDPRAPGCGADGQMGSPNAGVSERAFGRVETAYHSLIACGTNRIDRRPNVDRNGDCRAGHEGAVERGG